ncbi:cytochrome d ubiquinol oxidase subunit II [Paucidesulfovibrio longus]|uniref:cytochrome d ubiquinol oxidase subunit II n=1 Tax=Paucidesulfovibrio longus TaxID=889 RepID=UPI0003B601BC|nr:cytochrome d ubiquinol oxidase subunit II [Paucidesulfovibrio longus]
MLESTHLYLASIWFILWGVLWAVYFALDGFDLGVGTLAPFLAKTEEEKRIMLNAVGPFWDGNEVWLISAGGVTFAAFPFAYSVMFSWLYTPLLLLLFALILRGVSFEFRSKIENPSWKKLWDTCQFLGSAVPAILLGVAFANIFQGLPFNADYVNPGGTLELLNPYGLAGGVLFLVIFLTHGAIWLAIRTEGELQARAVKTAKTLWPVLLVLVLAFLAWSFVGTQLFGNYFQYPILFVLLLLPVGGLLAMRWFMAAGSWWKAWFSSLAFIIGTTLFGVIGLFPALMPASPNPQYSVTIHNSASSQLTLSIMLGVALVFVPIVIAYQAWAYKTFATEPVGKDDMEY